LPRHPWPENARVAVRKLIKKALASAGFELLRIPHLDADSSNFDENQVIERWLEILRPESRYCVDIGASDGVAMSNSLPLFNAGWRGLALECRPGQFASMARAYRDLKDVRLVRGYATPNNIGPILAGFEAPRNFGFLTLDIDGFDFFVLQAVLRDYRPSLICTEINLHFPPPVKFTVRFTPQLSWNGGSFYGQSIEKLHELCLAVGYSIVEVHYNNAFLVPIENAAGRGLKPAEAYKAGFLDKPDWRERMPWHAGIERVATDDPAVNLERFRAEFKDKAGQFDLSL
jgi:hypothetical protein